MQIFARNSRKSYFVIQSEAGNGSAQIPVNPVEHRAWSFRFGTGAQVEVKEKGKSCVQRKRDQEARNEETAQLRKEIRQDKELLKRLREGTLLLREFGSTRSNFC